MNELIQMIMIMLGVFFMGFIVATLLVRGFFSKFLIARISGGKRIVVKIRDLTKPRYKLGSIKDGEFLVYKDGKDTKRIVLDKECIYNDWGAYFVEVDPKKNCLIKYGELVQGVTGFDADKFESLNVRCLYKPQILDSTQKIMLFLIIIIIIACIVILFLCFQNMKKADLIIAQLDHINSIVTNVSLLIK